MNGEGRGAVHCGGSGRRCATIQRRKHVGSSSVHHALLLGLLTPKRS